MSATIRYNQLLSSKEIIRLLKWGYYRVDETTAAVYGRDGSVITPFYDDEGRGFVRLYWNGKRKAIAVSRLVWMSKTLQPIPSNFEIHHRDENPNNDAWTNLLCLHESDHRKLHDGDEEIPF